MTWLRRMRGPLAAAWLLSQLGTVALIPTALWLDIATVDVLECTCTHGDHAMCPMHHRSSRPGACGMCDTSNPAIALVASLVGLPGLAPPAESTQTAIRAGYRAPVDVSHESLRPVPPDPPPPRA
jgi:hypothetical protein